MEGKELFRIRKTQKLDEIINLNSIIFPEDELDVDRRTVGWIVYSRDRKQVGFCTVSNLGQGVLFLSRAGLLPECTGNGLHKRLIRTRTRFAREHGFSHVITYVSKCNYKSFVNLIKEGFEIYNPEYNYAGKDFFYLRLVIS